MKKGIQNKILVFIMALVLCIVILPKTGVTAAEDYRAWKQSDSRWGSIRLGNSSDTVSGSGCLVTSVTKLIIQAGLRSSSSFNVGTMVNQLNAKSGFTSTGALYYAKPGECVSGFTNYGTIVGSGTYSSSGYNSQILSWINAGYHMAIAVNGRGHWVAVDEARSKATGQVYIMDSLSSGSNADITLAGRYSTFNEIHAWKGGSTPAAAGVAHNPDGCFDEAYGGTGTVTVRGWGLDRDSLGTSLKVHVYVGGPAGSGAPCYEITANKYRPDVDNVFPGVGAYHGFESTINVSVSGTKTIYIYLINVGGHAGGDYNTPLGSRTVTISQAPKLATISGQNAPGTLNKGNDFTIYGTVSSNNNLASVSAGVYDTAGNCKIGTTVYPNSTSYSLYNLNDRLEFNKLTEGVYNYSVSARNAAGTVKLVSKPFVVLKNGSTISSGTYNIRLRSNTGYGLSILQKSNANEANVHLWTQDSSNYKKYKFTYKGNGYYTIQVVGSKKYLDVYKGSSASGTNVQQYQGHGKASQLWQVLSDGTGAYYLIPKCAPTCCLDLVDGRVANGQNVRIRTANLSNAQRWKLVRVEDETFTKLDRSSATIYKDTTLQLKATVKGKSTKVTWSTSNSKVATVSSSGKVTAKKAGTVTITAKANGKTAKCTVTVKNPTITLNKTKGEIYVGATLQLKATVKGKSTKVTWSTSNSKIATVSSSGKVTAKKAGKVTITAKANGKTAKCTVTVKTLSKPVLTNWKKVYDATVDDFIFDGVEFAVTWNKVQGASGYEVCYYDKIDGDTRWYSREFKTTKTNYHTSFSFINMHLKIKIRAYRTENGKTLYGPWSDWEEKKVKLY